MTVYVDNAYIPAKVRSGSLVHESRWCHMTADSTEELITFAVGLGLQPKYIQHRGTWKEHFDVTESKRRLAVTKGAVEVSYRDHIMAMAQRRTTDSGTKDKKSVEPQTPQ